MSLDFDSARISNPYITPEHDEWRSLLIAGGVNVNYTTNVFSPLHIAAQSNAHEKK